MQRNQGAIAPRGRTLESPRSLLDPHRHLLHTITSYGSTVVGPRDASSRLARIGPCGRRTHAAQRAAHGASRLLRALSLR